MQRITNLQLLNALIITILFLGLVIGSPSIDDAAKLLIFFTLIVAIGGVVAAASRIFRLAVKNKSSIWLQPVSPRVGAIVINSVVSVWLGVVALITFVVLKLKGGSLPVAITVTFLLLAGAGFGRYLQKRFSNNSLLPYGISFLGTLIMILIVFATFK